MHRSLRHILTGWKQVSENVTIPAVKSSEAKPRPHDLSFANWAFCLLPTFQNQKFSPNCLGWPIFRKLKCASVWRSQEDAGVNQQINLSWPHEDTKLQRLLVKELLEAGLKRTLWFPWNWKKKRVPPCKDIFSEDNLVCFQDSPGSLSHQDKGQGWLGFALAYCLGLPHGLKQPQRP